MRKEIKQSEEADWIQIALLSGLIFRNAGLFFKLVLFMLSWNTGVKSNLLEILYLISQSLS